MSEDTLNKLKGAKNYNKWIYHLCQPYLGNRILEVGCGTGNMTEQFVEHQHTVMATDIDSARIDDIKKVWDTSSLLKTAKWDVTKQPLNILVDYKPDTIICINMLEHIEDDGKTLEYFYELLPPGGKLIIFVPALQWLYGTLDEELDHFRRYSKKTVRTVVAKTGFEIAKCHYVNGLGIFGWWLNGKLLKRREFSSRQIQIYDNVVSLIEKIENFIIPPIGQSVFLVAKKC